MKAKRRGEPWPESGRWQREEKIHAQVADRRCEEPPRRLRRTPRRGGCRDRRILAEGERTQGVAGSRGGGPQGVASLDLAEEGERGAGGLAGSSRGGGVGIASLDLAEEGGGGGGGVAVIGKTTKPREEGGRDTRRCHGVGARGESGTTRDGEAGR